MRTGEEPSDTAVCASRGMPGSADGGEPLRLGTACTRWLAPSPRAWQTAGPHPDPLSCAPSFPGLLRCPGLNATCPAQGLHSPETANNQWLSDTGSRSPNLKLGPSLVPSMPQSPQGPGGVWLLPAAHSLPRHLAPASSPSAHSLGASASASRESGRRQHPITHEETGCKEKRQD